MVSAVAPCLLHQALLHCRIALHALPLMPMLAGPGSIGGVLSFGSLGAVGSVFCIFSALSFFGFLSCGAAYRVAGSGPAKPKRT